MVGGSKSNRKLLQSSQKHYIHFKFRSNDGFPKSISYSHVYVYFTEHKRKTLKNELKFGLHCTRQPVSPFFWQQIFRKYDIK